MSNSRSRLRGFEGDGSGASAVEFALIFPLLTVLMFGIVAVGQMFYSASSVQWAIERSARQLMIDHTISSEELEELVRQTLGNLNDLVVEIEYSEDDSDFVPVAHVVTNISYPMNIPFVPSFNANFRVETYVPRPF